MENDAARFTEIFYSTIDRAGLSDRPLTNGECRSPEGRRCALCAASRLTYDTEIALKEEALRAFWKRIAPNTPLDPMVASPLGRGYRTVSKRKVFHADENTVIGLIDPSERGDGRFDPIRCAIEPPDHAVIYAAVRKELAKPALRPLAEQLTYVIIKGTYTRLCVMFNVREIAPGTVKAANALSKRLSAACGKIRSSFLFEGDADDRYYQSMADERPGRSIRKLFGSESITVAVAGMRLTYPPLAFSQVNESMLDRLVSHARILLAPNRKMSVYDLYCGYGLFALAFAGQVRSVTGIERSAESIRAAQANGQHIGARNARFLRGDITEELIGHALQNMGPGDAVILDPPRGGTAQGVLQAIASMQPAKVLHLFCNIAIVEPSVRQWKASGYHPSRAIPLDMFPGTPNVELMLLFERQ